MLARWARKNFKGLLWRSPCGGESNDIARERIAYVCITRDA